MKLTNKERTQRAIRRAVRRPQGIAITVRGAIGKQKNGGEFGVVTVNLPKVIPDSLWHSFNRRRQFLNEAHALLRHVVYQLDVKTGRPKG